MLGRLYLEALQAARLAGCPPYKILVTSPPSFGYGWGDLRVVLIRPTANSPEKTEWVIAYTNYQRFPTIKGAKKP